MLLKMIFKENFIIYTQLHAKNEVILYLNTMYVYGIRATDRVKTHYFTSTFHILDVDITFSHFKM